MIFQGMTKAQVEDYRRQMLEKSDIKSFEAKHIFETEPYYLRYERKRRDAGCEMACEGQAD